MHPDEANLADEPTATDEPMAPELPATLPTPMSRAIGIPTGPELRSRGCTWRLRRVDQEPALAEIRGRILEMASLYRKVQVLDLLHVASFMLCRNYHLTPTEAADIAAGADGQGLASAVLDGLFEYGPTSTAPTDPRHFLLSLGGLRP